MERSPTIDVPGSLEGFPQLPSLPGHVITDDLVARYRDDPVPADLTMVAVIPPV